MSRDVKVDKVAKWNWERHEVECSNQVNNLITLPQEQDNDETPIKGTRILEKYL